MGSTPRLRARACDRIFHPVRPCHGGIVVLHLPVWIRAQPRGTDCRGSGNPVVRDFPPVSRGHSPRLGDRSPDRYRCCPVRRQDECRVGPRPYTQQIAIAVAASLALWLATIAVNGWRIDGEPRAFLGYAGAVTGIIIARPLELQLVDFNPTSSPILFRLLRQRTAGQTGNVDLACQWASSTANRGGRFEHSPGSIKNICVLRVHRLAYLRSTLRRRREPVGAGVAQAKKV